jgi:hypothetical protein
MQWALFCVVPKCSTRTRIHTYKHPLSQTETYTHTHTCSVGIFRLMPNCSTHTRKCGGYLFARCQTAAHIHTLAVGTLCVMPSCGHFGTTPKVFCLLHFLCVPVRACVHFGTTERCLHHVHVCVCVRARILAPRKCAHTHVHETHTKTRQVPFYWCRTAVHVHTHTHTYIHKRTNRYARTQKWAHEVGNFAWRRNAAKATIAYSVNIMRMACRGRVVKWFNPRRREWPKYAGNLFTWCVNMLSKHRVRHAHCCCSPQQHTLCIICHACVLAWLQNFYKWSGRDMEVLLCDYGSMNFVRCESCREHSAVRQLYIHTYIHTPLYTQWSAMYIYINTYIHTRTQTHIHTFIYAVL